MVFPVKACSSGSIVEIDDGDGDANGYGHEQFSKNSTPPQTELLRTSRGTAHTD
jgi:hypothetical protein